MKSDHPVSPTGLSTSAPAARRGLSRRRPAPLALEARVMFDGAVVASAAAVAAADTAVHGAEAAASHAADTTHTAAAAQTEARSTVPEAAKGDTAAQTQAAASDAVKIAAKPLAEAATVEKSASTTTGEKILFVDGRIPDYQTVVNAAASDVRVVVLDPNQDGIKQIADTLKDVHNLASISIVSHGDQGLLLLGDSALYAGDMQQYQAELATIGASLAPHGEILLYGCDVGKGDSGLAFIDSMADATGAVVAASTDSTGDIAHGGNWDLEISTGVLTSAPVLDVAQLADYDYHLYTTSVSSMVQLKAAIATASTDNLDDVITITSNITFSSASDAISINVTDGHKLTIIGAAPSAATTIDANNWTRAIYVGAGTAGSSV